MFDFLSKTTPIIFAALMTAIYSSSVQAQDGSTSGIKFRL